MTKGEKIFWLFLGAASIGGVIIYSIHHRNKKQLSRRENKPKSLGWTGNATTVNEPDWGSPFDMNFSQEVKRWLSPKRVIEPDAQNSARYAAKLFAAKGGSWYEDDDESTVNEVFSRLVKDGIEVAEVSRKFYWLYKQDLWEYLNSFLSESEMEQYVSTPVRSLAPYRLLSL